MKDYRPHAIATLFGGGYIASGASGTSRLPRIETPGLELLGTEGAVLDEDGRYRLPNG